MSFFIPPSILLPGTILNHESHTAEKQDGKNFGPHSVECYSDHGPATSTIRCEGEINFYPVLKKTKTKNINKIQKQNL